MSFKKNTAISAFTFDLVNKTNGDDVATGTVVGYITIDGGTEATLTNTPTHVGHGKWKVDLTAPEMNGDIIGLKFTEATSVSPSFTIKTVAKLTSELNDFNPSSDAVANVTLVDTTTTNTDMRGTDGANTIAPDNATIGTINTNVSNLNNFNPATDEVLANISKVSGSTLAADNLELQYNGTGLVGNNFPSTQQQLSKLATGSGGLSTTSQSVTITTGTEVGTFNSTFALDGAYHTINSASSNIDIYYQFDVNSNGVCTGINWDGYVQGNNNIISVYGYDWLATAWIKVGTLTGSSGTTLVNDKFVFTTSMTGTGANTGIVRVRFQSTNVININTDRILCEYTSISQTAFILHSGVALGAGANYVDLDATASGTDHFYNHTRLVITQGTGAGQQSIITDYNGTTKHATVKDPFVVVPDTTSVFAITPASVHASTQAGGYTDGAVYLDLSNGTAGTLIGVNGTSDKPCLTLADAYAIAIDPAVNSNKFRFDKGTAITTLDRDYTNWRFELRSAVAVDMNNQDVSYSVFDKAVVTGLCTNNTGVAVYETCGILDLNCGEANFINCGLVNSLTLSQINKVYSCDNLWSNRTGSTTTPEIIFNGDGVGYIALEGSISGKFIVKGMKPTDSLQLTGNAIITLDSTCVGGTVTTAGDIKIIDNSTTSPTFTTGLTEETYGKAVLIQSTLDAFNDLSTAQVKTEIVAALTTDAVPEPASLPTENASLAEKLSYIFAVKSNKINQTATSQTIRNRLDSADISSAPVSSDGTTTTRGAHS